MARAWPDTRPIYYGNSAERAAFPADGEAPLAVFGDYDDGIPYYWDGSSWRPLVGAAVLPLFMYDDASADIAGYRLISETHSAAAESTVTAAGLGAGATLIDEWVTPAGSPNQHFLEDGIYHWHVHAEQTAGTKTAQIYAEVYKRTDPGGVETLLVTTETGPALTGVELEYDLDTFANEFDIDTTDRIVLKCYAFVSGLGTAPTVVLHMEGDTFSRIEIPVPAGGGGGGGGGWPFSTITVDLTDADADYTGATSLEDALAAEGAADYDLGPGTYALTATQLPAASSIRGKGKSGETVITGFSVGGVLIGLPTVGVAFVSDVRITAAPAGGADGYGFEHNGGWLDSCEAIVTNGGGAGNMYGVFVNNSVTAHVYGGYISAPTACIYADTDSTVLLRNVPILSTAGSFFAGAGTITGVFQDGSGNLYEIDGAAGSERLINSFLKASDGAPDPAWSVDATGNLAAAGAYSLDVNAGELILDADADTSLTADTDDRIDMRVGGADQVQFKDGSFVPVTDDDVDLGDATHEFKDVYVDGVLYVDEISLDWIAWTPTVTQSGAVAATVTKGRYKIIAGICFVEVYLDITAAGTGGNAIKIGGQPAAIQQGVNSILGVGIVTDAGIAPYAANLYVVGATDWEFLHFTTLNFVGVDPNFALAAGDIIQFRVFFGV